MLIPQAIVQPSVGKVFDQTLTVTAAAIDTGANAIPQGFDVVEVWIIARTDLGAVGSSVLVTVNNDGGANYDEVFVQNLNTTVTGSNQLAQTSWNVSVFGSTALANTPSVARISIPGYAQTVFNKQGEVTSSQVEDTAADARVKTYGVGWRSTAAINQFTVTGNGASLVAGSRLLIYVR